MSQPNKKSLCTSLHSLQETYGTVQIKGHIDREQKSNYTLTVTAADGGVPLSRKVMNASHSTISFRLLHFTLTLRFV